MGSRCRAARLALGKGDSRGPAALCTGLVALLPARVGGGRGDSDALLDNLCDRLASPIPPLLMQPALARDRATLKDNLPEPVAKVALRGALATVAQGGERRVATDGDRRELPLRQVGRGRPRGVD